MANVKQVIAVRTDLNMRKGKIASQTSHASMKVFFDLGEWYGRSFEITGITEPMMEWMKGAFTKVVVGVDSEEAIYDLAKKATDLGIPHAVIIDNGFTEFHGNKTTTCIAIGPDYSEKIDQITKDLKLI